MTTFGDTLSIYFVNDRGYRWYSGRYNQYTGKPDQESKATRIIGTPVEKQNFAEIIRTRLQNESIYQVQVNVTPCWHSGFAPLDDTIYL